MRDTLADPGLARYAGRFVWLKLDFDRTENRPFVAGRGVPYTPSFYVIDPTDERATATQLGAMTLRELIAFLERGERGMTARTPGRKAGRAGTAEAVADASLARGDDLMARDRPAAAASARLPFVEDDYPKALADARHRKLPIFVEVSAPW